MAFLGVPWLSRVLGGSWPTTTAWSMAAGSAVLLVLTDAAHKYWRRHAERRRRR